MSQMHRRQAVRSQDTVVKITESKTRVVPCLHSSIVVIAENPGEFGMVITKSLQMFAELTAAVFCRRDVIGEQFRPIQDARQLLRIVTLRQVSRFDQNAVKSPCRSCGIRI